MPVVVNSESSALEVLRSWWSSVRASSDVWDSSSSYVDMFQVWHVPYDARPLRNSWIPEWSCVIADPAVPVVIYWTTTLTTLTKNHNVMLNRATPVLATWHHIPILATSRPDRRCSVRKAAFDVILLRARREKWIARCQMMSFRATWIVCLRTGCKSVPFGARTARICIQFSHLSLPLSSLLADSNGRQLIIL
jgi:hypothetical protein